MIKSETGSKRWAHGLALAAALTTLMALPVGAQEASVVLKNIDNLEKRVAKVEADLGRLKKAAPLPAVAAASAPGSDSSHAALKAKVEDLAGRLASLESGNEKKDAAADSTRLPAEKPGAAASTSAKSAEASGEIAELIREVKALTTQLKDGGKAGTLSGSSVTTGNPSVTVAKAEPKAENAKEKAKDKPALDLKGDIQIQGERKLTVQENRYNLDDFWGRLNFGAEYKGEDFESKINIRVFPEGFGFEPLTGATFDTTGQGTLKLQTQSQSRLVVNHAWVKYALGDYRLKVGRFETVETQSDNFGNYIDLAPSGKFMSRPAVHNALEFSRAFGPASASVLLGTNDRKLNRGFLRLFGKYAPSKKLQASAGWRANVFDTWHFEDEEILQRFDAGLVYGLPLGWKAFAEAALLQAANRKDDTPVLIGIQPDCGKVLDLLAFEMEWMPDRQVAKEDKEALFNIHARKTVGRFKLDLGLWSDLADADADAFGMGLRMTSGIK